MRKLWAVLPPPEYLADFHRECRYLGLKPELSGNLFLFSEPYVPVAWAASTWQSVERVAFSSISEAGRILKPLAKKWRHHSGANHRRGELIQQQLRPWKEKEMAFPEGTRELARGTEGGGVFTLENEGSLLYSLQYDRPFPSGEMIFREDKTAPSRAYLKLWEALTLLGDLPKPGDRCLEVGASPGGWTWVIAGLGAQVIAVDRSPLSPAVAAMPGVEFRSGDAFQYTPEKVGAVDWLFSDLICYPEKLLEFVREWVASGKARNMICTIKFQGEPSPAVIGEFQKLGRVLHLHHNKHELTWCRGGL